MAEKSHGIVSKRRTEAITDGFFATVMTILALTLIVPAVTGSGTSTLLASGLRSLLPNVLSYVISFLLLGVLWIGHNNLFLHLTKANRRLQWLTLIFLLTIGFIPFTTALLGRYPFVQIAVLTFGINLFLIALMYCAIWLYISGNPQLTHGDQDCKSIRRQTKTILISPIAYAVAILVSFLSIDISIAIFIIMPIFYIVNGVITDSEAI